MEIRGHFIDPRGPIGQPQPHVTTGQVASGQSELRCAVSNAHQNSKTKYEN